MGTRSWSSEVKYKVGESVFVKAGYFDNGKAVDKYSDFFVHKEESLLEGTILSIHKASVRVKFLIDDSISSIKYHEIEAITDENRHLIYDGKSEFLYVFIIVLQS